MVLPSEASDGLAFFDAVSFLGGSAAALLPLVPAMEFLRSGIHLSFCF
jgi:hypothetical protein